MYPVLKNNFQALCNTTFISVFAIIFFASSGYSQPVTYVPMPIEWITFDHDFEKSLFEGAQEDSAKVNWLALFVTANPKADEQTYHEIKTTLDDFLGTVNQSKLKKPKKFIKYLYKDVHDTFFDKYEEVNQFTDIFSRSAYNCVSGSGVFAYLFENLEVPFVVQEYPTHVNLMAYPDSDKILVETTDPQTGYISFDSKFKKQFANHLRANKLISEAEYNAGPDAVFEGHYMKNTQISTKELAALQYFNNAIYALDSSTWSRGLTHAAKAYYLYPTEITKFVLLDAISKFLEKEPIGEAWEQPFKIATLFDADENVQDNLLAYLGHVTENELISKGDTTYFALLCNVLLANSSDSTLQHRVQFVYHNEMSRFFSLKRMFAEAFPHAIYAFEALPENVELQNLTTLLVLAQFENQPIVSVIPKMEALLSNYPIVLQFDVIKEFQINALLQGVGYFFYSKEADTAEQHRKEVEALLALPAYQNLNFAQEHIEVAYREAALFYFKKGQTARANTAVNKGLQLYPTSRVLQSLKKLL